MGQGSNQPVPPPVDAVARSIVDVGLPWPLLVDAARAAIASGVPARAREFAEGTALAFLRPVINATGVLLHTNLGRAPLSGVGEAGASNLEFSLRTGKRGRRSESIVTLLRRQTGCEDALVVNNGAGAILLALAAIAAGKQTFVSRSEAVEIGGGFRIPDVVAQAGTRLVDVGTTNRTRLSDYELAAAQAGDAAGCVLRVHTSNFTVEGFTESTSVADLTSLGLPIIYDLGSGLLDSTTPWLRGPTPKWLRGEPAARQVLEAGASLVTFSGDKLLAGPQAGIIAGDADLVERCAAHPLARALRPGALVLSSLQQTLLSYMDAGGGRLPFWDRATSPVSALEARAAEILRSLPLGTGATAIETAALVGAGTAPGTRIESVGIALPLDASDQLRRQPTPVIALRRERTTVCDLRSVGPEEDRALAVALNGVLA